MSAQWGGPIQDEIDAAVREGSKIRGNDGCDVVLRGNGWYFEHFRIDDGDSALIVRQHGPYQTVGVSRMIERAYREKWSQS